MEDVCSLTLYLFLFSCRNIWSIPNWNLDMVILIISLLLWFFFFFVNPQNIRNITFLRGFYHCLTTHVLFILSLLMNPELSLFSEKPFIYQFMFSEECVLLTTSLNVIVFWHGSLRVMNKDMRRSLYHWICSVCWGLNVEYSRHLCSAWPAIPGGPCL